MKNTVICLLLFGISLTASAQEKVETVSMRYETQNDMPLFYQKMKENLTYPMDIGRRRFCSVFRNILVFLLICWFLTGMARSRQYCCFTITVRIFR